MSGVTQQGVHLLRVGMLVVEPLGVQQHILNDQRQISYPFRLCRRLDWGPQRLLPVLRHCRVTTSEGWSVHVSQNTLVAISSDTAGDPTRIRSRVRCSSGVRIVTRRRDVARARCAQRILAGVAASIRSGNGAAARCRSLTCQAGCRLL